MPHTPSAKKRLRQNIKRRLHNRAALKDIKAQLKRVQSVAATGTLDELKKEYNLAAKKLDKAAAKQVVHRNLAARKKSQLARALHKKKTAGAAPPASPPTAGS
jgi:small subunit ribosomal protein S20